jgi:uncharacterized membrane protein YfcA
MSFPHTLLAHALLWPSLRALSPGGWCIVVGALFAGGLVKGIVSIGVPLIAIPLLTGLLSVKQAVLLISMPIIIGNIPQAAEGGHTWPALKKIAPLVIGAVIGIALGVHILFAIPGALAAAISGGILIVACLVLLFAPRFSLPARTARPAGFIAGLLSGLMEGISAIPGPLLATYLIASGSTGRRFTKEISVLIAVFGQLHHANAADLVISALASVPVIAGIIAGRPLRDALPPRAFRVLVLVFIIVAAGQMILRSGIIHA